jgi:hypothetical protein
MKAGREHLYYTDTDSIFTTKKFGTGDGLGQLKLEYKCRFGCFILPKTYMTDKISGGKKTRSFTMKGFDRKKIAEQNWNPEDFVNCLRGEVHRLKMFQEPKFATLKTALSKGKFLMMNFDPETRRKIDEEKEREYFEQTGKKKKFVKDHYSRSERAIKSRYDKRVIIKDGFYSNPIHLEET